jgi:hypothetical protein
MASETTVLIPKSTAHQAITCMGALADVYRRTPVAGAAQTIGELVDDRALLSEQLKSSGDTTVRMPASVVGRISDRLASGAHDEGVPQALRSALLRTGQRLRRWIAEATSAAPVGVRR